ncbi:hypothetical protein [Aquimarina agarivorans]|uniref:hypothetical protein n=1 Tax=Aquimarina agarivorans TaxID=980584 RepID=UPI001110CD78|nr:hypothetical protein [Aquimarina agarivorans]
MITLLKRNYYLPLFSIALVVIISQKINVQLPIWMNNHLNDFLFLPIVFKITLTIIRYLKIENTRFIPVKILVVVTILCCIWFEVILPKFNSRYTADIIDVGCYFLGTLFFVGIEQPYLLTFRKPNNYKNLN